MRSGPHPLGGEPRTDRPRTNADPAEVARKLALLDEPHVKPLSDFVRTLRADRGGDESIPWFDPTEAGTEARILMLLEAPGRKATVGHGSGFVSPDNNDGSAENMWNLLREAGVERRREVVTWNVIPWYIGSESRVRGARADDIREAHEALVQLMKLLPDLRVVVLLGNPAAGAWQLVGVGLPTIRAPHPSPKNLNSRPHYRALILQALREARRRAGYADLEDAMRGPSVDATRDAGEVAGGSPRSSPSRSMRASPAGGHQQPNGPRPRKTPDKFDRESIRDALRAGLTPDQIALAPEQIGARHRGRRAIYLAAIEEEARLQGALGAYPVTPDAVADLRDHERHRWERIAARVFGDARKTSAVKALYDQAKGEGSSRRSYTGRGRRFPGMED